MDRVTVRLPTEQVDSIEELAESGRYPNRSEVVRTAVRKLVDEEEERRAFTRQ